LDGSIAEKPAPPVAMLVPVTASTPWMFVVAAALLPGAVET
jgi:hypothetical protein